MGLVVLPTPLGRVAVTTKDGALTALRFLDDGEPAPAGTPDDDARLAAMQLAEWFSGDRRVFTVPTAPPGTPFQRDVWRAVAAIPFGSTATYGEIAERVGRASGVRAVAAAIGRNPVAVVIPCHRVLGRDGALRGYAWGLDRKRALLAHEAGARG